MRSGVALVADEVVELVSEKVAGKKEGSCSANSDRIVVVVGGGGGDGGNGGGGDDGGGDGGDGGGDGGGIGGEPVGSWDTWDWGAHHSEVLHSMTVELWLMLPSVPWTPQNGKEGGERVVLVAEAGPVSEGCFSC